jgi:inositol transporter-like SP family MFS transporter
MTVAAFAGVFIIRVLVRRTTGAARDRADLRVPST